MSVSRIQNVTSTRQKAQAALEARNSDVGREREKELRAFAKQLGYKFREWNLLNTALTHSSYSNENPGAKDYERLEFLGDAVLELVVTEILFRVEGTWDPKQLTNKRKEIVMNPQLKVFARAIDLPAYMRLGNSERKKRANNETSGWDETKVLADAFEAVLGAMYSDGGKAPVTELLMKLLSISPISEGFALQDSKTQLKELADKYGLKPPQYVEKDAGEKGGNQRFTVDVQYDGVTYGPGVGRNKRAAQQEAARIALGVVLGKE